MAQQNIKMRQIKINKYEGNTHYTVHVVDSYGQEHHVGFYRHIYTHVIQAAAEEIWSNEVKQEEDLLSKAIAQCIRIDEANGLTPSLD